MAKLDKQLQLLKDLYRFSQWSNSTACSIGCSSCCTKSVTITALEGLAILHHCTQNSLTINTTGSMPQSIRPVQTTNQFVNSFILQQNPIVEETEWSFEPCMFLDNGACLIYSSRPIMCRGFISFSDCTKNGFAEVPQHVVSYNTIMQQIVEHVSCGMAWGLMDDIFCAVNNDGQVLNLQALTASRHTLQCHPIPGFILTDNELSQISSQLVTIKQMLETSYPNLTEASAIVSCIDSLFIR